MHNSLASPLKFNPGKTKQNKIQTKIKHCYLVINIGIIHWMNFQKAFFKALWEGLRKQLDRSSSEKLTWRNGGLFNSCWQLWKGSKILLQCRQRFPRFNTHMLRDNQSIKQIISQSVSQSNSQSITQSLNQSVSQSVSQLVGQFVVIQSVCKSVSPTVRPSVSQSVSQSISQ